ncbi:MAG: hypothetical protein KAT30_06105 [Candidatus Krumholzibacteria bacterium]|nr:hypothetical protein [Candidatus Krumholzibacteria bacterium]
MAKKSADERREIAIANLRRGKESHGVRRHQSLSPESWDPDWRDRYEARVNELLEITHVDDDLDVGAICQVARVEVLLLKGYDWLGKHNLIGRGGQVQPVCNLLLKLETQLMHLYSRAGLNPASRRQMGLGGQKQDLALLISALPDEDEADFEGVDNDGSEEADGEEG